MSGLNLYIKNIFINVGFFANYLINIILPSPIPVFIHILKENLKSNHSLFISFKKSTKCIFMLCDIPIVYNYLKCKY